MKLWECDKDKVIVDEYGNEWKWDAIDWWDTKDRLLTDLFCWDDIEKINFTYKKEPKKLYAFKNKRDGQITWFVIPNSPHSQMERVPEHDIECKKQ
jgi:hypothetical protein